MSGMQRAVNTLQYKVPTPVVVKKFKSHIDIKGKHYLCILAFGLCQYMLIQFFLGWSGLVCFVHLQLILFMRDYARLAQHMLINMYKHDITLSMACN